MSIQNPGVTVEERYEMEQPSGAFQFAHFSIVRCEPEGSIPSHVHACHEVALSIEGTALFTVGGDSYTLRPGDLRLVKPGQEHSLRNGGKGACRQFHVAFTATDIPEVDRAFRNATQAYISDCTDLLTGFQQVFEEARQSRLGASHVIQSLLTVWLVAVARRLSQPGTTRPMRACSEGVEHARIYIERNARHRLSLAEVSKAVGISVPRLEQLFSLEMGVPVGKFARQVLMERAARLVTDGQMTVSQIAESLGFPSIHYFSASFRRHFGVPPSAYGKEPSVD